VSALKLAKNLSLPVDAVTQTFLIVGKRGSGKSNTAARFVEQLHHAGIPFVVLDPVDTWWGLKAGLDGGRGLDVYVFGGRKADLPLEAGAGALIAEVLCEHRLPMVLSVKHLSGRERSTFMVAFAQTLFQKWSGGPLHMVLEEAHELAPQSAMNAREGEQQMLGAFKRVWKLGRSSGIGGTAITQRPASLSKDITTQSEILIAHRTIGPQDVKAIGEWIKYHGEQSDILAELPSLPTGEAFVWAPEFPEGKPIGLLRTSILLRETYDSASTPKVGERRVEPKELAPVDLERLRAKMAATIEKAKAEDPRELRKEIHALRTQLTKALKGAGTPTVEKRVVDQATIDRAIAQTSTSFERTLAKRSAEFVRSLDRVQRPLSQARDFLNVAIAGFDDVRKVASNGNGTHPHTPSNVPRERPDVPRQAPIGPRDPARVPRTARNVPPAAGELTGPEQRILDAIAWEESLGITEPNQVAVAFLAGYTFGSGGFNNPKGSLRTHGYIAYFPGSRIGLTEEGRAIAHAPDATLTDDALHRRVLDRLPGPEQRLLAPLLEAYPEAMSKESLAEAAGYTAGSGGFNNPCGRLRSLGLVEYPSGGQVRAADVLFPVGART
jgi:hypothetical protein